MTEPSNPPVWEYRFEDVRVDTRAHRISKAGVELALEPKAFAVLVALLEQCDRVVERDRLLDAVWGHRHVTPAVLNRVIALLRRALADDADHPRLIRTIHGVGYSFIGMLGALPEQAAPAASMTAADNIELAPAAAPDASAVPSIAAVDMPRPGSRGIAAIVGLAAVVAVSAIVWRTAPPTTHRARTEAAAAVAANKSVVARLVLLPIDAGDTEDDVQARGLTELLFEALARVPDFALTGLASARKVMETAHDPGEIGRVLDTDHVLRGRLERRGIDMLVTFSLVATADGRVVWSERVVRPRGRLLEVLPPVLEGVHRAVFPDRAAPAPDAMQRGSAAAQALYWDLVQAERSTPEARAQNLRLLRQVVAIDPDYALGWSALAVGERARYVRGETSLQQASDAGMAAVDRALAIDPNLIEALIAKCNLLTMQWRSAEALGVSRRAIELAPNDARAIVIRANVLGYLGRPRETLPLRKRAVALDPLNAYGVATMNTDFWLLGERDAALDAITRGQQLVGSASGRTSTLVPRIELAFGNLASGLRAALRVVEANPPVDFPLTGKLVLAQAWSRLGEHQRARAVFDALQVELPEIPSYALTQLELLWAQGRFAEARDWIETAGRAAAQDPWQHVASAQARALAGDTTGALADFAQALDGSADRDLIVGGGWLPGRTGLSSLGNWIALRKSLGQPYQDELADFVRRLDAAVAGGTNLPSIDYLRAMQCALRDDPQGADRALGTALSRGWVDPLAFEVDLAWAPYRNADWLQRQRAAQSARIAQERQKLAELLAP